MSTKHRSRPFHLGEEVRVHAMGHWYLGEVVKLGRTRVTVRYTSGTGVTREKAVNPATITTGFGPVGVPHVRHLDEPTELTEGMCCRCGLRDATPGRDDGLCSECAAERIDSQG